MPPSDDCTCADCVNRLRHDHDRAQAQALEALLTLGNVADELRAIADRLSQAAAT